MPISVWLSRVVPAVFSEGFGLLGILLRGLADDCAGIEPYRVPFVREDVAGCTARSS